ncbi:hypothetical protein GSY69_00850 [Brevibacterium sp. 5221]|uniref:Solute-binding protein family 5 domain-containing protein n=1 Tax=Brevibacterium rongguiense TaxID=2695267 RepID=A0A6N9H4F4_9MICO|nr:ABC transporter substrate-binding protein [Brevibacterium rongguiense]MYM18562.1 hypothetical protein [Brevibacterium rongguiense]
MAGSWKTIEMPGWHESKDKRSWTFKLRRGVEFHSGKKLTADDVVFSLNYARNAKDEKNQWASEFELVSDVKKIDDETVRIDTSKPWTPLPSYLALFAASIYPKDFGGHDKAYMETHEDGTGPFELESWTKGQSMKLKRNPAYWKRGVPSLNTVAFNVVSDDNTRMLQLQGGQIDIDEGPAALSMATLGRSQDITAADFPSTRVDYFNINTKAKGLDDPKVRRAMSYALNRDAIVKVVYGGYAQAANSYISPGLAGHDDRVNGGEYNMDKARQLMRESSHPDGVDVTLQITAGDGERELQAQIAQQTWADLGIRIKIQKLDSATMTTNRSTGKFDIAASYATSDVADTSQMIAFMGITDGSGIRSGYANPDVKRWYGESLVESDTKKRDALFGKIQQRVADDAPLIPIVFRPALYGVSKQVQGFRPAVLGTYGLKETRLERD